MGGKEIKKAAKARRIEIGLANAFGSLRLSKNYSSRSSSHAAVNQRESRRPSRKPQPRTRVAVAPRGFGDLASTWGSSTAPRAEHPTTLQMTPSSTMRRGVLKTPRREDAKADGKGTGARSKAPYFSAGGSIAAPFKHKKENANAKNHGL